MFSFPDARNAHNRLWWIGKTQKMAGTSWNSFNGSYRVQWCSFWNGFCFEYRSVVQPWSFVNCGNSCVMKKKKTLTSFELVERHSLLGRKWKISWWWHMLFAPFLSSFGRSEPVLCNCNRRNSYLWSPPLITATHTGSCQVWVWWRLPNIYQWWSPPLLPAAWKQRGSGMKHLCSKLCISVCQIVLWFHLSFVGCIDCVCVCVCVCVCELRISNFFRPMSKVLLRAWLFQNEAVSSHIDRGPFSRFEPVDNDVRFVL